MDPRWFSVNRIFLSIVNKIRKQTVQNPQSTPLPRSWPTLGNLYQVMRTVTDMSGIVILNLFPTNHMERKLGRKSDFSLNRPLIDSPYSGHVELILGPIGIRCNKLPHSRTGFYLLPRGF